MANCGNFLEYAGSKCGLDVGFGKMILILKEKQDFSAAELSAQNINSLIASGDIIGVVKGWNTVAGASVGEVSIERVGTGEMKLIRPEILADVLTFESGLANNEILADIVKAGSLNCILLDDRGNAFGDRSQAAGKISTMLINFSTKATSSMQYDNATEKTVNITARYLVKELSVVEAGTEVELIESKSLLVGQLKNFTLAVAGVIGLELKDKATNDFFDGSIAALDVTVKGTSAAVATAVYVPATGILTITFDGAIAAGNYLITISGDVAYMKETSFVLPSA